jgi:N-acetylmuramoyl-L-alanine amidase
VRDITAIVVHCSATPQNMDIGADWIRAVHVQENHWSDIGYHYVIRRNGKIERGRPDETPGAHVSQNNATTIGVCLVGGLDADDKTIAEFNYTMKQCTALYSLLRRLTGKYKGAIVCGHRDFPGVKKACPVFDAAAFWNGGK